jgi:integrase
MARKVKDAALDSREARLKLRVRGKPYWRSVGPALHVGYRRLKGRAGTWSVRRYLGTQRYTVEVIGAADDGQMDADGVTVLTWWQAVERARGHRTPAATGPYTVDRACDDYLEHLKTDGRSEAAIKDATYRINAHIRPALGKCEVAALEPKQLRAWRADLARRPPRLRTRPGEPQRHREAADERGRKASANRILATLKALLNHAFDEERVPSNRPWGRRVKPFENAQAARARFLSVAEAQRLMNASEPAFRALVTAALMTGMRYGELSRLVVADFNRDAGTVVVRLSKTKQSRQVMLTTEGAAFFAAACAGRAGDELMFRRANGEPWVKSNQVRPMALACAAARIKPAAGFHILRHSWASLAVMAGMPLLITARNLGHTDTRMVEKHYGHLAPSYVADEIRAKAPRFGIEPSTSSWPSGEIHRDMRIIAIRQC